MEILISNLRAWRNRLAGEGSQLAFDGFAPIWPGGAVHYVFDSNVTPANQKAFLDGAAEWAMFANLQFIPRTSQPNYIRVIENPSLGGGQSAVGMVGGEQLLEMGPGAWNRATICHEIGHALGMVHEHQRSDRDGFVTVHLDNVTPGLEPNFVVLGNSLNQGAYDFRSIMHYNRNSFSIDPDTLNTIEPKPAYSEFLNSMGVEFDPALSAGDRAGAAARYGAGPGLSPVVTNTADSGPGSLRAALYYALDHPGTTITFNVPATDPNYENGFFTIRPTDRLPALRHATVIDGDSQPVVLSVNGPRILLNGELCLLPGVFANGLQLKGTNCVVDSLTIHSFNGSGIEITGYAARSNIVRGCYLGVNETGLIAATNGFNPLIISGGASWNVIGGTNVSSRNVISGSAYQGMLIRDEGTRSNVVIGNFIGLDSTGTAALGNTWNGVEIHSGAQANRIGGATPGARNVISGNALQGIAITGTNTSGNLVEGNWIGLAAIGAYAITNGWSGVNIWGGARSNRISGNVISGNAFQGVLISELGTDGNAVVGNFIGVNLSGTAAISNGWSGVEVYQGPRGTIIGGETAEARNIISGNGNYGVLLNGGVDTVVQGNRIGTDASGAAAIPNSYSGIGLFNAHSNLIGGATAAARNLISGNLNHGLTMSGLLTSGNRVLGNYIGVDAAGGADLGNGWAGVGAYDGPNFNRIGGTSPGEGNLISGNANQGVVFGGSNCRSNAIQGNWIGLATGGSTAIPNTWPGIEFWGDAAHNLIGGGPGGRNIVSGNSHYGILLSGAGVVNNRVQGNTIGLDAAGTGLVPNTYSAIAFHGGASSNVVGGTEFGAANLVVGSAFDAVYLTDSATANNAVRGNSIFNSATRAIGLFSGANNDQPAPTLSSAALSTNTTVSGSFTAAAATIFDLDFYSDLPFAFDAECRTYLGSAQVTSDVSGNVSFNISLSARVPAGRPVTATATDPFGNTSMLSFPVTVTVASATGDGIPDSWRAQNFGGAGTTTNGQSCATCDPDADGLNNLQEFLAATNPTNSASVLKLVALAPNSSNAVARVTASAGIVYRIEKRSSLGTNSWSLLADQVVAASTNLIVTDPSAAALPMSFYRAGLAE